ncbi:MAG: hypothetical protein ABR950_01455 [Candidatus Dormibacteria bacterium]|jgi:hypothetical protein
MADTPDEPGSRGLDGTDLDPEDAPVEMGEEGSLLESRRHWQFPTDLDVWVGWVGAAVVGVAAFETLAALISGSLWGGANGYLLLPPPDGFYSLLLLAGVLVLVLRRPSGAASAGWVRAAACLAAGTGGALVVAQVAGNIDLLIRSLNTLTEPAAYVGGTILGGGIGALAEALTSAFAAVLAVLLYRWSRGAAEPVVGGAGESGPMGVGESAPEPVMGDGGSSAAPEWRPRGLVGPAVASLLLGALVAGVCVTAAAIGTFRTQTSSTTPTSETPAFSIPSPPSGSVEECTTTSSAATFCTWVLSPSSVAVPTCPGDNPAAIASAIALPVASGDIWFAPGSTYTCVYTVSPPPS